MKQVLPHPKAFSPKTIHPIGFRLIGLIALFIIGLTSTSTAAQTQSETEPTNPSGNQSSSQSQSSDSAQAPYQQFLFAYRLLERQEFEIAAQALDQYLANFPNDTRNGDARYYRALLYRQNNQPSLGLAILEQAPAPTLLPKWRMTLLTGQLHEQAGQLVQAEATLHGIDVLHLPNDDNGQARAQIKYELAQIALKRQNITLAVRALQDCATIDSPYQARAQLQLGQTLIRMSLPEEASSALQQAAQSQDAQVAPAAGFLLGKLQQSRKLYPQAQTAYSALLERFPNASQRGQAAFELIKIYTTTSQPEQVVQTYQQHAAYLPQASRLTALYLTANAQIKLKQNQQALAKLQALTQSLVQHHETQGDWLTYPAIQDVLLLSAQIGYQTHQTSQILCQDNQLLRVLIQNHQ